MVFFSYVFSMMFHDLYFHWILFDMELVIVFVCFDLKVVNDPRDRLDRIRCRGNLC